MNINMETEFKWNGKEVKIKGYDTTKKSALEIALIIQGQSVTLCPVNEGRLRGSITIQTPEREIRNKQSGQELKEDIIRKPTNKNETLVGTACYYGPYIEYGTIKMKAQPFMRPSLDLATGKSLVIIERNGKREFKDYL
jgi:hypothetical protein